jgi:hypothetical protein
VLAGGTVQPVIRAIGFPVNIPSGTRLAVRARSSSNSFSDRHLDMALYGVDTPAGGGGGGAHAHASWS